MYVLGIKTSIKKEEIGAGYRFDMLKPTAYEEEVHMNRISPI